MRPQILTFFGIFGAMMLGGFATLQTLMMLLGIRYFAPADVRLTIGYGFIAIIMILISIKMIKKLV